MTEVRPPARLERVGRTATGGPAVRPNHIRLPHLQRGILKVFSPSSG